MNRYRSICRRVGCLILLAAVALPTAAQETRLTGYLVGSPPNGLSAVLADLNGRLKRDIGVSVTVNYIGWGELNSKYPLVLATGEGVDWIYTADWCQYAPQAVRGAFKELRPEMIKKYMPRHWTAVPEAAWEQAKVNGKIYMIPSSSPDRKVPVVIIRGDLRRKYGLPPLKSFADIEPYLAAVKQHEMGLIPMILDNGYDLGMPFGALLNCYGPPNWPVQLSSNAIGSPFTGNFEDPDCGVYNITSDKPFKSAFLMAVRRMKRWYDLGYINKNPFANTTMSRDAFALGKSAVAFGNSQNITDALAKAKAAGYQPEVLPSLSSTGHYIADPYTTNGVAIAASSRNVEKTLQFLDLIMQDPDYGSLVYFGIEGQNWALTPDGKIGLPPGLSPDRNTYPWDASGFWFINKDLQKPLAIWDESFIALRSQLSTMLVPSSFNGFAFAPDQVRTEVANVNNVWQQYGSPLTVGVLGNVDQAYAILVEKLRTAGVRKVQDEIRRQVAVFLANRKKSK